MEERDPRDLRAAAADTVSPQEKTTMEREEGVDMTQLEAVDAVENDQERVPEEEEESMASDGTLDLEAEEQEETIDIPVEIPVEDLETEETMEETCAGVVERAVEKAVLEAETTPAPQPEAEAEAVDAVSDSAPTKTADKGSSSSSSSSSDSSSSDSSDSSDSEVEDVTELYKSTAPAPAEHVESEEDEDAEQWFEQHDLEVDGMEVVAVVRTQSQEDAVEDDVDVFLLPEDPLQKPATTAFGHVERGSATKRRRPEHEVTAVSDGQETTSSSDPEQSENEFGRRKASKPRKKIQAPARAAAPKAGAVVKYTSVPPAYSIFENIPPDDSEFPVLKGKYTINGGHRAHFSGHWGFTEADFAQGVTSKFEYSSGYIHGRGDDDRRPFSGKYGGYFNLRQFNGKIVKIKEDVIEFHFIRLAGEELEEEGDETKYEVLGDGKNRYGRFLVRGYFNAEDGRMRVRRRYLD